MKKSPTKAADRSQIGLVEDHYTKNTVVTISDEEDEKAFKTLPNKKQEVIKKSDPDQSVLRNERLRLQAVTDENEQMRREMERLRREKADLEKEMMKR